MFLRTAAAIALVMGLAGSSGEALAQFYPGPPGVAPPPFRAPLPPASVDDDDDLPPYDPPPGYRRAPQSGTYAQPPRTYESEALPPPGPYGAAPGEPVPNSPAAREPAYGPPPGQYGAREPAYGPPPGQYGAREPAYGPPPGYEPERGPVGRPQYGVAPPPQQQQQQDSSIRPPMGIGPGGQQQQQGAVDPDITSRLPMDDRPETGPRKELPPQFRRTTVEYRTREPAGTIVIDTANTYLYLVLGNGQAIRYGIGVGREGFTWNGAQRVSRMAEWPDWHPPSEMIERQPYLPRFMAGGEGNPLGARALYLGNTLYRIHGTNQPSTIGTFVSSGCIRLTNEDVERPLHAREGRHPGRGASGQAAGNRIRSRDRSCAADVPAAAGATGRELRRADPAAAAGGYPGALRSVSQIRDWRCPVVWTGHRRFGAPDSAMIVGHRRRAFFANGVGPRRFERTLQVRGSERGQFGSRPALFAPRVRHRRKGFWRQQAFQFLLVGREVEIGGLAVGGERHIDARNLERGAVEMRRLGRAFEFQRHAAQIVGRRHAWTQPGV